MAHPARSSSSAGWALVVFAALTAAGAWPLVTHFATALPSDLGDPALNTWILWWNAHAVPLSGAWWNAPMFWPAPNAFALSESLLGLAPLTTPLIRAGVSPVAAYNVVFLLAGPLSALGAYLLAWRLTRRRSAALIAAFAFGFSPYRIAQLPHLQMEWACGLPLVLYCLHAYVESSERRWLAGAGVCWLLTGLSNGYFLIFFPILIALWTVWFVRERRHLIGIGGTFVISTLPMLPVLLAYRARQQSFGFARGIGEIQAFSADVTALWASSPQLWLSSLWTKRPGPEGELYPGIAIAALAIAGAVALLRADVAASPPPRVETPRRRRVRRWLLTLALVSAAVSAAVALTGGWDLAIGPIVWTAHKVSRSLAITFWLAIVAGLMSARVRLAWHRRSPLAFYLVGAAAMFVMALGPDAKAFGATVLYKAPYSWLMLLPGGDSMRVPARFAELMILCLSIAGALAWARLVAPGRRRLTALAAAAVLCEGWMILPVAAVPPPLEVPALASQTAILELPMTLDYPAHTRALLHAIAHGHPIVNGFSGYEPPHFGALRDGLMNGDITVLDALRSSGALAVFVDRSRDTNGTDLARVGALPGAQRLSATSQGDWILLPAQRLSDAARSGFPDVARSGLPESDVARSDFPDVARSGLPESDVARSGLPERVLTITASVHNENAAAMLDGKLNTRWTTDDGQEAGTTIRVSLGRVATVSAIELRLGRWAGDFPTDLSVSTEDGGGVSVLWLGSVRGLTVRGALADPRAMPIVIRFDHPVALSTLTIRNNTTDQKRAWSVAELRVLGR